MTDMQNETQRDAAAEPTQGARRATEVGSAAASRARPRPPRTRRWWSARLQAAGLKRAHRAALEPRPPGP